jgi:AraC-like DNA-binding protein
MGSQLAPHPGPAAAASVGTGAAAGVDLQRLAWLRLQPPLAVDVLLRDIQPGHLLTSRCGDLSLFECHSQWQQAHVPPLGSHLLVLALAPVAAVTAGLPAPGPNERLLNNGDVLIIPAGTPSYVHLPTPHHLLLLALRPRLFFGDGAAATRPAEPPAALCASGGVADPVIQGITTTLRAAATSCAAGSAAVLASHLARALAAHLLARHATRVRPARSGLGSARLQRVLAFMEAQLAEPVVLAEAARVAGCSVHHFAHLFKAQVGLSPMRYLLKLRMQRALELVQTTQLGMGEIGWRVGMPNAARFSQAFRAYWNSPPSALRRRP